MRTLIKIILISLFTIYFISKAISLNAQDNRITVFCSKELGPVNKKLLGNNLLAYDPSLHNPRLAQPYYGHTDYGAGIWDPKLKRPVREVIDLLKEAGITVLRFPGGCGSHFYDWKKAIGKKRKHYSFGLDEFLRVCRELGAEPIITVSDFTGTEKDAAKLVRYLEPYGVTYFELGNETYHGNHRDKKEVLPEEYAKMYLKYYDAMKKADPSIKIGAVFYFPEWNRRVLEEIIKAKADLDFWIIHIYPLTLINQNILNQANPQEIYSLTIAMPTLVVEPYFRETLRLIQQKTGKDIPVAVTEYNSGPGPYRHTLASSLINAELLQLFMQPKHNVLMANHWNLLNEYWGMLANGFRQGPQDLYNPYYKRPNFYVFEFYHKHFGDTLLDVDVDVDAYDLAKYQAYKESLLRYPELKPLMLSLDTKIPELSVNASKSQDGNKVYLMVINKHPVGSITATIDLKDFIPAKKAKAWVLNGPDINASEVKVNYQEFEIKNIPFDFTFEPHSLTAMEIEKG